MNGKTIQIKTVEKLIIQELYNSESSDHRVHRTCFLKKSIKVYSQKLSVTEKRWNQQI